jgi:hypothetical protein
MVRRSLAVVLALSAVTAASAGDALACNRSTARRLAFIVVTGR